MSCIAQAGSPPPRQPEEAWGVERGAWSVGRGALNCAGLPRPRGRAGARLFQQPDLEIHWVPMRNRALPSVMAFVAQASKPWSVRRFFSRPTPHAPRPTPHASRLAGWGLTQNDRASFVGWCPQPSAVGPVPHQPGFLIKSPYRRLAIKNPVERGHGRQSNCLVMKDLWPSANRFWVNQASVKQGQ